MGPLKTVGESKDSADAPTDNMSPHADTKLRFLEKSRFPGFAKNSGKTSKSGKSARQGKLRVVGKVTVSLLATVPWGRGAKPLEIPKTTRYS